MLHGEVADNSEIHALGTTFLDALSRRFFVVSPLSSPGPSTPTASYGKGYPEVIPTHDESAVGSAERYEQMNLSKEELAQREVVIMPWSLKEGDKLLTCKILFQIHKRYILNCLAALGEYQEILGPMFQRGGIERILFLLQSQDIRLLQGYFLYY